MSRQSTFILLPRALFVSCLVIVVVVPQQFESIGWLWLLIPSAILLNGITLVFFAFSFMLPNVAKIALCVSRFPRAAAAAMTAGSGYMMVWFIHGAAERGWNSKLTCLPGLILLATACFYFFPIS